MRFELVGGARARRLPVTVANFLRLLSQATGQAIEGIIGYNYLRGFTITIDCPGSRLRLSR